MKFNYKMDIYNSIFEIGENIIKNGEIIPLNKISEIIMINMMKEKGLTIHGPYHHFLVPYTLLVSSCIVEDISNEDYEEMKLKILERSKRVPAKFCCECGASGTAIGVGIFISTYVNSTPRSREELQWSNMGTAKALYEIAKYPGPRCCKRTSYISLQESSKHIKEVMNIDLPVDDEIKCVFYNKNPDCIKNECPFYK